MPTWKPNTSVAELARKEALARRLKRRRVDAYWAEQAAQQDGPTAESSPAPGVAGADAQQGPTAQGGPPSSVAGADSQTGPGSSTSAARGNQGSAWARNAAENVPPAGSPSKRRQRRTVPPSPPAGQHPNLRAGSIDLTSQSYPSSATGGYVSPQTTIFSEIDTVVGGSGSFYGLAWNDDGTKLIVGNNSTNIINVLDAPNPFDMRGWTSSHSDWNPGGATGWSVPYPVGFNDDGTKFYVCDLLIGNDIQEWSLSTPYDVTTSGAGGTQTEKSLAYSHPDGDTLSDLKGAVWHPDGDKLYIITRRSTNFHDLQLWTASSPWDVSTLSYDSRITPTSAAFTSMSISGDANTLILGTGNSVITVDISGSKASDLSLTSFDAADTVGSVYGIVPAPVDLSPIVAFTINNTGDLQYLEYVEP